MDVLGISSSSATDNLVASLSAGGAVSSIATSVLGSTEAQQQTDIAILFSHLGSNVNAYA